MFNKIIYDFFFNLNYTNNKILHEFTKKES